MLTPTTEHSSILKYAEQVRSVQIIGLHVTVAIDIHLFLGL